LKIGGKTLISADEIDRILSGKADLPDHPARLKAPKPHSRPSGRRWPKKQPVAVAE